SGHRTAALIDLHAQLQAVDGRHLDAAQIDAVLLGGVGLVIGAVGQVLGALGRFLGCVGRGRFGAAGVVVLPVIRLLVGALALEGLLLLPPLSASEQGHGQASFDCAGSRVAGPAVNPPLEPKPASARWVSSSSSTCSRTGARKGTTTSCAMRSPRCRAKDSMGSVLCRATLTGPRYPASTIAGPFSTVMPCLAASPERGQTMPTVPGGRATARPVSTSARPPGGISRSTALARSSPASSVCARVGMDAPGATWIRRSGAACAGAESAAV